MRREIERGGYEPDDPTLELYQVDDDLAEVDRLRGIILDGICHSVAHGFWHFAFFQARGWSNIFDALRVMFRLSPGSIDALVAGMSPVYRKHVQEFPHARAEIEKLWEAYSARDVCENCKKAVN